MVYNDYSILMNKKRENPNSNISISNVRKEAFKTIMKYRKISLRKHKKMLLKCCTDIMCIISILISISLMGRVNADEESERQLPYFIEPIPNKTVVVGRDVILPCAVDNLKGFKVAWIFVETQTILTIHHTIITKNPRFSLARHDHKHWYLQISDVKPSDRGLYMCQVNSDPMMSQVGFLDVQVPPDIIDDESSSEVVVQEGHDVSLRCKAKGSPRPLISWKREDGGRIHLGKGINLKVSDSEVLHIPKVSRLHMGAYLCIASNNVPPSVSKRITLKVQFAPVLWIPNQLVGVSQGMDVTLECHTEAFPRSINYWTDNRGLMILSNDRYDSIVAENGYKSYMRLKIKGLTRADYGTFGCTAKNSFGESNGTIKVYEYFDPTSFSFPFSETTPDSLQVSSSDPPSSFPFSETTPDFLQVSSSEYFDSTFSSFPFSETTPDSLHVSSSENFDPNSSSFSFKDFFKVSRPEYFDSFPFSENYPDYLQVSSPEYFNPTSSFFTFSENYPDFLQDSSSEYFDPTSSSFPFSETTPDFLQVSSPEYFDPTSSSFPFSETTPDFLQVSSSELPRELLINAPDPKGRENSSDEETAAGKRKRKKNNMNGRSREQKKFGEGIEGNFSSTKELLNGSISTMTPDGVINFDVQRLYKENRGRNQSKPKIQGRDFMHIDMSQATGGNPGNLGPDPWITMALLGASVTRFLTAIMSLLEDM